MLNDRRLPEVEAPMAPGARTIVFRPILLLTLVAGLNQCAALADDPWPEYQRTTDRLGRTSWVGPQTLRVEWSIQFDTSGFGGDLDGSPVMDEAGRLFIGGRAGLTCIDSSSRVILWEFFIADSVNSAPSLHGNKVLFGSANDTFYCVHATTGELIWSESVLPHPHRGQVIDQSGREAVVYFPSESDVLYARIAANGTKVWTVPSADGIVTPPALDGNGRIFLGGTAGDLIRAHAIEDGGVLWLGPNGTNFGVTPVEAGKVYAARFSGGPLYCCDSTTGDVLWTYSATSTTNGAVAVGHRGIIYVDGGADADDLIAVSDRGDELWRYSVPDQIRHAPVIAGDGTIYVCSSASPATGHVHAIREDGTGLWTKEMPDKVDASPMLAPDGTLYVVCNDRFLYAFQDPAKGDVSLNDIIDGRDIRFFIRVLFGVDDDEIRYFAADMNSDGMVDVNDVPLFVDTLLTVER